MCKIADETEVSSLFQAHDTEGGRNDDTGLLVVRGRDSLKGGKALQSLLSTSSLLVNHTSNSSPNHRSGALEVEGTTAGVGIHVLLSELGVLDLITSHYSFEDAFIG